MFDYETLETRGPESEELQLVNLCLSLPLLDFTENQFRHWARQSSLADEIF